MLRRRELMANQQGSSILPAGYTELKYLSATTTQYIILPISADIPSMQIKLKDVTDTSGTTGIVGAYHAFGLYSLGGYRVWDGKTPSGYILKGQSRSIEQTITVSQSQVIIDDYTGTYVTEVNHPYTLPYCCLFGFMKDQITLYNRWRLLTAKVYFLRVYDDGNLICDLLPALNPSGKPCMYDIVTQQPLFNDGTGEFGYELLDGTIVNPT